MPETVRAEGRCGTVEWAACSTPYPGQHRSGDAYVVEPTPNGVLIAVIDALGHGEEAAVVADRAVAVVRASAWRAPVECVVACHLALHASRGAALTVARMDPDAGEVAWVAVGNVAALVSGGTEHGAPARHRSVPLRGGVVGDRLPPLRQTTAVLAPGDILVSATDGLSRGFPDSIDASLAPASLARRLLNVHARGDDDALVLVARCNGSALRPMAP